ncbi:MAG: D-glutamate deacylase [Deltaproteobacteria bacterium]|nr:D-glutamate deacylase [Deltaproteobacteria bacterium]NNK44678.1 D-glutamate deacylase [Myxococcales bacterium]
MTRYWTALATLCVGSIAACQPAAKQPAPDTPPAKAEAAIPEDLDLVILNGRVMDPESGLDDIRNIGVKDGVIQTITSADLSGAKTIDASGHVVAPGFIDYHLHGQDPFAVRLGLRDGVTSQLDLEGGAYPVEDYYDAREGKTRNNYGVSVSHAWARISVMDGIDPKGLGFYTGAINAATHTGAKWNLKRADPEHIARIQAELKDGLDKGALGIGVPIGYYTAASSPELNAVASVARDSNSFLTTHVRYMAQIPPSGYLGLQEILSLAAVYDLPLLVHHVPSNCLGLTVDCLDLIDEARAKGMKVVGEFYPYIYGSSVIGADYLGPGFRERTGMDYSDIIYNKTGERMTEALLKKYRAEDPGGDMLLFHIKKPQMLAAFQRPGVFQGSDGMPFRLADGSIPDPDAEFGGPVGHPRGAGARARILRMVREDKVISLMEALAKLSYLQASFLEDMVPQMKLRGRLKPGAIADITIFDPETVADTGEWAEGKYSLPSTGIPYVIVNGVVAVSDSKVQMDVYAGQPIRNEVKD